MLQVRIQDVALSLGAGTRCVGSLAPVWPPPGQATLFHQHAAEALPEDFVLELADWCYRKLAYLASGEAHKQAESRGGRGMGEGAAFQRGIRRLVDWPATATFPHACCWPDNGPLTSCVFPCPCGRRAKRQRVAGLDP